MTWTYSTIGAVAGMMVAPVVYLDPNMMGGILLLIVAVVLPWMLTVVPAVRPALPPVPRPAAPVIPDPPAVPTASAAASSRGKASRR